MKFYALIPMLVGFAASAGQNPIFSVSCKSRSNASFAIELSSESFINYSPEEMDLRSPVATVSDGETTWTGRAELLMTDENYKPRKYKNHMRFDLSKLVNEKTFGSFHPSDQCRITVMFPNEAGNRQLEFEAPVVINCDQSGGSQTLDCVAKKVRD